ncbi:MAG: PDZ domain-containing protein, partial [Dehalococcoidales bacterium]|nr:PDZ domain-containing protein [Dehalococcoidales bacterium]
MSKPLKWLVGISAGLVVSVLIFTGGVMLGSHSSETEDDNFAAIEDAWRIITEEYVEKDNIDTAALSQAAIEAMMDFIDDPYSTYLNRESYLETMNQLEGKYEGIGTEVSIADKGVVVIGVYTDSPAEKAGIKPGNIITAVNGEDIAGMGLMDIVLKVRGPKGTSITLTVLDYEAGTHRDVAIIRDEVHEKSVHFD